MSICVALGRERRSLDRARRVPIPARWREEFGGRVLLASAADWVWVTRPDLPQPVVGDGWTWTVEVDPRGRVHLPHLLALRYDLQPGVEVEWVSLEPGLARLERVRLPER